MTENSTGRSNHRLDIRKAMLVAALVEKEFVEKCISDDEFAKYAEKTLNFKITAGNIRGLRESLNVPSMTDIVRSKKELTQLERLTQLEASFSELQRKFSKLVEQLGGVSLEDL